VQPGTRFTVEQCGDAVILRKQELSAAEDPRRTATPAQRIASLEEWIANLPHSPALPRQATRRESMYD